MGFCMKCGKSITEGDSYCKSCGASLYRDPDNTCASSKEMDVETKELLNSGKKLLKSLIGKIISIITVIIIIVVVAREFKDYRLSDVYDVVMSASQAEEEHVLSVKRGCPYLYPNVTYEEAFSAFFDLPTWKYFVGTQEGPDDDGDGLSDYVLTNQDVVEFTGYCMYQNTRVRALIQFVIDGDSFSAVFLSFNDIPQNNFMIFNLMATVFENYED